MTPTPDGRSRVARHRQWLGAHGEALVASWYEAHGYCIVVRNWRCREGEIDIVAKSETTLVFCEVKTRTSTAFGAPGEAVTWSKQARLRRLAALFLTAEQHEYAADLRFDVASVLGSRVEVIEGAF